MGDQERSGLDMTADGARRLIHELTVACWMSEDPVAMAAFFHEDATIRGAVPGVTLNVEDYAVAVDQIKRLLTVKSVDVRECLCDRDGHVAFHLAYEVRALATGFETYQEAATFLTLKDGRISNMTVVMDHLNFLERAGMLPDGAGMVLLAGGSL